MRDPYVIAAVMDESVDDKPLTLNGCYIDLFDPTLPIKSEVTLQPGTQALLIDMDKVSHKKRPQVLAASFRESDEDISGKTYSFTAKSPIDTDGIGRVLLPARPKSVKIDGAESYDANRWDPTSKTYLVSFENIPEGHRVAISY